MDKKREFDKIVSDIKSIKIQGARNVAKFALKAYSLVPTKSSKEKLINSRPTEPMMFYALNLAERKTPISKVLEHFDSAQNKINEAVFKLIKSNEVIFTHCHSTNVINALIYSHKKGKKFQVYNTETRPLFQGRKTATELKKAGIKITMFVDSGLNVAISGKQGNKKVDRILIGADALLKDGIINKIGSELVSQIAKDNKVPVYIVADSWKFSKSKIKIEQRNLSEVWDNAPKNIKIKNPAFEFVPKKLISGIITEHGLMKYDEFVRAMRN